MTIEYFKQFRIDYNVGVDDLGRGVLVTDQTTGQTWRYHSYQYQQMLLDIGFVWGVDTFREVA